VKPAAFSTMLRGATAPMAHCGGRGVAQVMQYWNCSSVGGDRPCHAAHLNLKSSIKRGRARHTGSVLQPSAALGPTQSGGARLGPGTAAGRLPAHAAGLHSAGLHSAGLHSAGLLSAGLHSAGLHAAEATTDGRLRGEAVVPTAM
jgi:hypothetical protein